MRAIRSCWRPAPLEQRTRLLRATEAFDAVMERQGRALAAAKTITEGLVNAIAQEVAAQRPRRRLRPSGANADPVPSPRSR